MKLLLTMRAVFRAMGNIVTMRRQIIGPVFMAVGFLVLGSKLANGADQEGIAVAIVYDTSGSMKELVKDAKGMYQPKYRIANRALDSIVQRIQTFASTPASSGGARKVHCGLVIFSGRAPVEAVKFGPFDAKAFQNWLRNYAGPDSATPLGAALEMGSQTVLRSGLIHKHVVVITDGINTAGPEPAKVMPRIKEKAASQGTGISTHFVAFDVDAKVFDPVKKLGATVVGASDEKQLNTQLEFIFEKKILLEDEEPKPAESKPK
jgi:von Willebrand factor type A domain-containing protein